MGSARIALTVIMVLAHVARIMAAEELDIAPVAPMETGAAPSLPLPGAAAAVSACFLVFMSSIAHLLFR